MEAGRIDELRCVSAARPLRRTVDVIKVTKPERSVRVVAFRDGIDAGAMGGRIVLAVLVTVAEERIADNEVQGAPFRQISRSGSSPAVIRHGLCHGWQWPANEGGGAS